MHALQILVAKTSGFSSIELKFQCLCCRKGHSCIRENFRSYIDNKMLDRIVHHNNDYFYI